MTSITDFSYIIPMTSKLGVDPLCVIQLSQEHINSGWPALVKDFGPIILSCLTVFIACFQFILARAQHRLSQKQTGIAEDKHRLELYEKRFETYELFLDLAISAHKLNSNQREANLDSHEIKEQQRYLTVIRAC